MSARNGIRKHWRNPRQVLWFEQVLIWGFVFILVRAWPAKVLKRPLFGNAPVNSTYLDTCIVLTRCIQSTNPTINGGHAHSVRQIQRYEKFKGGHNRLKHSGGAACVFVSTSGLNTRLNVQTETRHVERSIAALPIAPITTCLIYRNGLLTQSYLFMDAVLASATDTACALASANVCTRG